MAQSRLEKVGTIYSRVSSLMKAGAMPEQNKPMWFEIYKSFPPKHEPRFDRPGSTAPIRQIFYAEDKIRARFHKEHKNLSGNNLMDNNFVSRTEQFLLIYKQLELDGVHEDEIYEKAVTEIQSKLSSDKSQREAIRLEAGLKTKQSRKKIDFKEAEDNILTEEDKQKYKPIRLRVENILSDNESDTKKSE